MEKKVIDINIRERMKQFLLKDVISPSIKVDSLQNIQNSILILDKSTEKIINSCIKMIDLVEEGIVGNSPFLSPSAACQSSAPFPIFARESPREACSGRPNSQRFTINPSDPEALQKVQCDLLCGTQRRVDSKYHRRFQKNAE